ncbi:MAG: 3-dehydroquinate synthase [Rubrivivax sp.]
MPAAPPSPPFAELPVVTPGGSYPIRIGSGLLSRAESWQGMPESAQAVIVSQPQIDHLYGDRLQHALSAHYPDISRLCLPDGEAHKNWNTLNLVFDHLLSSHCDRRTVLVALGGGVVGDITGLAAAIYQRGVRFVQVPTTLLAQVDSSVGGKTAINHPLGKNMIGAFHQPALVVCDLDTLDTLAPRELSAGLAEVIKYGPIADPDFLDWIETNLDALLARDRAALAHAVQRSCEIKAEVVGADERETGQRAILNFGHTFGHAIEAGLGYGQWLHGEAVGCGMVMAAALSAELGLVSTAFAQRLRGLIGRAGLPVAAPPMASERWFELMRGDKKADAGAIRYVLIDGPGRAVLRSVPDGTVAGVIAAHTAAGDKPDPASARASAHATARTSARAPPRASAKP